MTAFSRVVCLVGVAHAAAGEAKSAAAIRRTYYYLTNGERYRNKDLMWHDPDEIYVYQIREPTRSAESSKRKADKRKALQKEMTESRPPPEAPDINTSQNV